MNYFCKYISSPVGKLKLVATHKGLAAVLWENDDPSRVVLETPEEHPNHPVILNAERQLNEYFAGERREFSLEFDVKGTLFQRQVWQALQDIPFGETRSYGELARHLGRPKASRAVGAANGRNPLSIIVPCHRVIGASGKLVGFAGGLDVKRKLLSLESVQQAII